MLSSLPHARNTPNQGYDPSDVLAGIREICAAEPESAGLAREIRSDREAESLARWADDRSAIRSKTSPPHKDELTGGEHLVTLNPLGGIVFKSTHPGKFGFGVDLELIRPKGWKAKPRITAGLVDATPTEYLNRLAWQNEIFQDGIRVLGVVRYPQGLSVLTTQPFYEGRRTEQSVIDAWFVEQGWDKLPTKDGGFYNPARDLLIMDAFPRNVLTLTDGDIFPFDVVIVQPSDNLKARLDLVM